MSRRLISLVCCLLLWLAAGAQGTLDPTNPPEPSTPDPVVLKYKLTLSTDPVGAAKTLTGGGEYEAGKNVTVRTTGNTYYTFLRWEKDGVTISTAANFTYTMPEEDVTLVAVYSFDYNPSNPGEPTTPDMSYPLYLVAQPANGGSFNRASGGMVVEGSKVTVKATPATGFVFLGWFGEGDVLLTGSNTLSNYVMPSAATTLTARFEYNPSNPSDPSGNQDDVDDELRLGDADSDGNVTINDAIAIVNYILGNQSASFSILAADVDEDGQVTIADAVSVVNILMNQ
jgi:hypothetical protein